jgi:quercetin dioxygenase-like cupin family protein
MTSTTGPHTGNPRRIVAADLPDGRGGFTAVGDAPDLPVWEGYRSWVVWGSDRPITLGETEQEFTEDFIPPVGGTRMLVTEVAPGEGLHNEPKMHATDTIDYLFVLSGELDLLEEDGTVQHLKAGDCIVQTGTNHAWRNPGTEPARFGVVLVGIART